VILERTKFWREPEVDLLHATYVTHSFAPHTHDSFALGVITGGVERFKCRGATHNAGIGSVVLVNPGEVHTGHAATPNGWTYRMFYPEVSLLERAALELGQSGTPYFPEAVVDDADLARRLIGAHAILEIISSQLERDEALLGALRLLISRHAEHRPTPLTLASDSSAMKLVRDHLETHFRENTSLSDLSKLAGLSTYHLTRVFKRTYGLPPHALQTQLRVAHARRRILAGTPLGATALEAGFSDQSHLTRLFKRVYGVSPGVYARTGRKNVQDAP
jgi:AraC-like DNA-binding protein